MNVPTLRTLTYKSTLWFGKHNGKSIQQMFDLKLTGYLRWVYYYYEGISFIPEIIKELHIYTIPKPGCDKEKAEKVNHKLAQMAMAKANDEDKDKDKAMHNACRIRAFAKKEHKVNYMNFKSRDKLKYKKSNLAWKNQGH